MQEGETDWLAAAAGDEELAEELRTGKCRCGKMLGDDSAWRHCRHHEAGRRKIAELLHEALGDARWRESGRGDAAWGRGPRGEDLELLARYVPKGFLLCYEILVCRGLVLGGGGRGYDETVEVGSGRPVGGLGTPRSGVTERRLTAGVGRRGSSGAAVIRDEAAVSYRASVDRKLRKIAREMSAWLEEGPRGKKAVYRCTGKKCGKYAEPEWNFCPTCGAAVDESKKRGK